MNSISLQAHRQRGGTLVGFIAGLLIGLASALSVAIYVTRVPVPFVDRTVSRNPAEDVLEAERNKGWNPNAGLATKQAPVPAVQPLPEEAPAAAEGAIVAPPAPPAAAVPKTPAATTPAAPAAGVKVPATPKTSDPLGDLAQSRLGQNTPATAPAAAPASGTDPFVYFVQVGAYRSSEDAETQRARLAMLGLTADVTEREQSGRTVFRVRVGPYSQKTQADNTRDQLSGSGVEAAVVRVQR